MDKFAKLFEKDGKQVLVTRQMGDDGEREIAFRTTTKSGHSIALQFGFKETQEEERDALFEKMEEERAFAIVSASPGIDM